MSDSKELLVVAGANGTGKTTFALEYVARSGVAYLGADAIAESLSEHDSVSVRFQAGREFLARVADRLNGTESFVVETTMSGVGFRKTLQHARASAFTISIVYLYVDNPETCIARIAQRVRMGGHHVPEVDVRRRFWRSISNFWNVYREMADHWVVMYNAQSQVQNVVAGSGSTFSIRDTESFAQFQRFVEEPSQ
ncbi:MAG: AAA family ATPase [Pirellulales bacterium]|nr:AAA family ATPase [Pirellulales bacterium]